MAWSEILELTTQISNHRLTDAWKGTTKQFLAHFKEKLRLLDCLSAEHDKLPESTRIAFLQQAAGNIDDLCKSIAWTQFVIARMVAQVLYHMKATLSSSRMQHINMTLPFNMERRSEVHLHITLVMRRQLTTFPLMLMKTASPSPMKPSPQHSEVIFQSNKPRSTYLHIYGRSLQIRTAS